MGIVFTVSYVLRAVYTWFLSDYKHIMPDHFTRTMLWILLYMVWDVPSILSILLLHWKKTSVTQDQAMRSPSPKNNRYSIYSTDYDSSFLGKSSSLLGAKQENDFDITINSNLSDDNDKETDFELLSDLEPELSFY